MLGCLPFRCIFVSDPKGRFDYSFIFGFLVLEEIFLPVASSFTFHLAVPICKILLNILNIIRAKLNVPCFFVFHWIYFIILDAVSIPASNSVIKSI